MKKTAAKPLPEWGEYSSLLKQGLNIAVGAVALFSVPPDSRGENLFTDIPKIVCNFVKFPS